MTIEIDQETKLTQLEQSDAKDIFETIDSQREYLGRWLPFVALTREISDSEQFVDSVVNAPEARAEYVFAIKKKNQFVGLIGFKDTDRLNRKTEIGYWLSEKFQKQGIVTKSVDRLCEFAFHQLGINRIQIKCAVENQSSRLLSFWTEDYDLLLQEAKAFSAGIDWQNDGYWEMPEKFRPSSLLRMISENDRLTQAVGSKSADSYLPLTVTIDDAALNGEEKEFLKLWLYALLFTPENVGNEAEMAEMNAMATGFLETYKGSDYAGYTRRFIRHRFRTGNWGFGSPQ